MSEVLTETRDIGKLEKGIKMTNSNIIPLLFGILVFVFGLGWILATFNYNSSFSKLWFQGNWSRLFLTDNKTRAFVMGGGFGLSLIIGGFAFILIALEVQVAAVWTIYTIAAIILASALLFSLRGFRR